MAVELIRTELQRLLHERPFRAFIINMVGGEHGVIEHSENLAFDPRPGATTEFVAITGSLRLFSTFESISSIARLNGSETMSETRNGN